VIVLFMVQLRLLKAEAMAAKRRHVVLGAFIVGALLTPPDVLTQLMLAIPLILLYEMAILYARFLENSKFFAKYLDQDSKF
jgi:sec-independent protein translocase protein TatC